MGPKTAAAEALHATKYRSPNEGFREAMNRIAATLTKNPEDYHLFRDLLLNQTFLPAGRIQSTVGTTKKTTPYNCFVSGSIGDSSETIFRRLDEAWQTMRMGGGIGYDFSTIRPSGDPVRSLHSTASGPISFMDIFNAMGLCVASSGHRRGAQMGILRVDHPDIEHFIHAKQNTDRLTGFNISIAVTDAFMQAVVEEKDFTLQFEGRDYQTIHAPELWEQIMRSTWDWAEPGVVFIDRMNDHNNLNYCETISATNPCSEQPLPPYGACLLGSFNLVKYLRPEPTPRSADSPAHYFDFDQFAHDIPLVVKAMDRVVDVARYPLGEQRIEAENKRRMGLGVTGLANTVEAMGHSYGSPGFLHCMETILSTLKVEAYRTSATIAKKRGAFPLYNEESYLSRPYIKELPDDVQDLIKANGIRNSHLISIAPTGTISQCADNVSSGIEPVWDYSIERPINLPAGPQIFKIEDFGYANLGISGRRADDISAQEHVEVLTAAQKHVDSAISKTCNVSGDMPWADFKQVYMDTWLQGGKACSTFNKDGKRMGLLASGPKEEESDSATTACYIDPDTGVRECG